MKTLMNHLRNTYCIDKNLWSCIITPVLWLVLGLTILYYWTCCPAHTHELPTNNYVVPDKSYTDCTYLEDGSLYCTTVQLWNMQGNMRFLEKCGLANNWCEYEDFKHVSKSSTTN